MHQEEPKREGASLSWPPHLRGEANDDAGDAADGKQRRQVDAQHVHGHERAHHNHHPRPHACANPITITRQQDCNVDATSIPIQLPTTITTHDPMPAGPQPADFLGGLEVNGRTGGLKHPLPS